MANLAIVTILTVTVPTLRTRNHDASLAFTLMFAMRCYSGSEKNGNLTAGQ